VWLRRGRPASPKGEPRVVGSAHRDPTGTDDSTWPAKPTASVLACRWGPSPGSGDPRYGKPHVGASRQGQGAAEGAAPRKLHIPSMPELSPTRPAHDRRGHQARPRLTLCLRPPTKGQWSPTTTRVAASCFAFVRWCNRSQGTRSKIGIAEFTPEVHAVSAEQLRAQFTGQRPDEPNGDAVFRLLAQ
jgi:hypothetical protein